MIYALRTSEIRNGFIKIGFTDNPIKRVPAIKTACPYKVDLIYLKNGTMQDEARMHRDLEQFRSKGEWFKDYPEVRDYLGFEFLNCHQFGGNRLRFRALQLFFNSHKDSSFDLETMCRIFGHDEWVLRDFRSYHYRLELMTYDECMQTTTYQGKPFEGAKKVIISNVEERLRDEEIMRRIKASELETHGSCGYH